MLAALVLAGCNVNERSSRNDDAAANVSTEERQLSPKEVLNEPVGGVDTEIVYCRPSARGRTMIGGNNPFGEIWRTGANEATTIKFSADVLVEGQPLSEGKYALFTIPGPEEWVIIFNKDHNQWGAYNYNPEQDVLRVSVKAEKTPSFTETFTILPADNHIALVWEHFYVPFTVEKSR